MDWMLFAEPDAPPFPASFVPVFLIGAETWRADAVSRFEGSDLDAVAGSGTMKRQEDGQLQHLTT